MATLHDVLYGQNWVEQLRNDRRRRGFCSVQSTLYAYSDALLSRLRDDIPREDYRNMLYYHRSLGVGSRNKPILVR